MIRIPIFEALDVEHYRLYPGYGDRPGLHAEFEPGLTLVIGANGLGKSTLVHLMYRMCTGPNDIRNLPAGDLGSRQFDVGRLGLGEARAFAARVSDNATSATAKLTFRLGDTKFELVRHLQNMEILSLRIDGASTEEGEGAYQEAVNGASGVGSFTDWILLLRYLVFYFDDRRSLVWDPSAQRQILRLLFLPPDESAEWTALEREVLSLDSHVRNLNAMLTREEIQIRRHERTLDALPDLQRMIDELTDAQSLLREGLDRAQERLADADSERQSSRLQALRAAEDRENAYRALESARLRQLQAAFPTQAESAEYILGYLLAADICLVCGNSVPATAEELRHRVDTGLCVVCNSAHDTRDEAPRLDDTPSLDQLQRALSFADTSTHESNKRRSEADEAYRTAIREIAELETTIAQNEARLNDLIDRLPPEAGSIRSRRREYNAMHSSLEQYKFELTELRRQYNSRLEQAAGRIVLRKDEVKHAFDMFAQDFLLETCQLAWTSQRVRLGQSGESTEFGSFEVDMPGRGSDQFVRRTGANQVSESQREFIDLAFRMALMTVAGASHQGSLIIDAPESSLDAVFAPRAARVLMRFGETTAGNRLIITSNLVDGQLIPTLLREANIHGADDDRIVNLFDIAVPTAAIEELRDEYDEALVRTFRDVTRA